MGIKNEESKEEYQCSNGHEMDLQYTDPYIIEGKCGAICDKCDDLIDE